ncbi:peroxiredoxin [bacterium I07]|nr:peroxiredoxin [bacterium I07]
MSKPLKVGDKAADFDLPAVGDKKVKLSDLLGSKKVILSFHPLAFTGICADQMKDLDTNQDILEAKSTVALGISIDSVPAKEAWKKQLGIEHVEFLSDFNPKGNVAEKYGIYRSEDGFSERAVYVIDEEGLVIFAKVYPIGERPDVEEILNIL